MKLKSITKIIMSAFFVMTSFNLPAFAAEYPDRPIKLLVGVGPGGYIDLTTRQLAAMLTKELGQSVLVVNTPGGGGNTAVNTILNEKPDGYTIAVVPSAAFTYNPVVMRTNFNMDNFTFISSVADQKLGVFSLPNKPWKTLKEAFEYAKKENKPLTVAVPGAEAIGVMGFVGQQEGVRIAPIPQQGGSATLTAVLGGHADIGLGASVIIESIKANKIIPLASASAGRFKDLPEVPTLMEQGYDVSNEVLLVLFANSNVPKEITDKLEAVMVKLGNTPEYKEQIYDRFFCDPSPKSSAEVTAALTKYLEKNKELYAKK